MIHPACEICRGACCESLAFEINAHAPDEQRWIEFHGLKLGSLIHVECRCKMLVNGKCSVYADRPQVCQDYAVGSQSCRDAVSRRRAGEEREAILAKLGQPLDFVE